MKKIIFSLVGSVILIAIYLNVGFYSIQPIGALPEGVTAIVWRQGKEPFFNSPDAMCLLASNSVSLMCRIVAMGAAPRDRIIVRLSYKAWAYSLSVDGKEFSK